MVVHRPQLPIVRSHERIDYKRCPRKWYYKWRKGYVLKTKTLGALDLGTWVHDAFADWYLPGLSRNPVTLPKLYRNYADKGLYELGTVPEYVMEKAEELTELGEIMCTAYQAHYGLDPDVEVIGAEIPLEFSFGEAKHLLKPDLVYANKLGDIYLMEHKTASSIRTEHLVIDDQARPYGAMAERALKNAGVLGKNDSVKGIMYNFLRKAIPDERPTNEKGQSLNKNGTVSARQPAPVFVRKPIYLSRKAKAVTLRRIAAETTTITILTQGLRTNYITPDQLGITPHSSCSKFCDFFTICCAEEDGLDIRDMTHSLYTRQNPYTYGETTSIPDSFEMG